MEIAMESREVFLLDTSVQSAQSAQNTQQSSAAIRSTSKSLYFCLSLENPFNLEDAERLRMVDESMYPGQPASGGNPSTFLEDEDLCFEKEEESALAVPQKLLEALLDGFEREEQIRASEMLRRRRRKRKQECPPNKFQKTIELLLRFRSRGIEFYPGDILEPTAVRKRGDPNYFHGFRLVERNLLTSPDSDETYIRLHVKRSVLLAFAELHGLMMMTNPYSAAGGGVRPYSRQLDFELGTSVVDYLSAYDVDAMYLKKDGRTAWGFRVEVPQKMRLAVRLLREPWRFGGCGFPVDKMKNQNILVKSFFPLHNREYLDSHKLLDWASLRTLFSLAPLAQNDVAIRKYFGEQIGLYFIWLRSYTGFLFFPAAIGTMCGVLDVLEVVPRWIARAVCCLAFVLWSYAWNRHWARKQNEFARLHGQEMESEQQLVRDQFVPDRTRVVELKDIFELRFDIPLTLQKQPDGTMVEYVFPESRRHIRRILITYPCVVVLTAVLTASFYFVNGWRFQALNSQLQGLAASAANVAISLAFGKLYDLLIQALNDYENNRTDEEQESQYILKSFFFYFVNTYLPMFFILWWPSDEAASSRLDQLSGQMFMTIGVKPCIQDAQEIVVPWVATQLRLRKDETGSWCSALCSMLCCRSIDSMRASRKDMRSVAREEEGAALWREAQMQPFNSTAEDYLEVVLQYGFMALFCSVFPFAPLLAFVVNTVEIRVDAMKYVHRVQRPFATPARTIGAWEKIMGLFTLAAIPLNAYVICILSPFVDDVGLPSDEAHRWQYFAYMQYILVGLAGAIMLSRSSTTPDIVLKMEVKQRLLQDQAVREKLFEQVRITKSELFRE